MQWVQHKQGKIIRLQVPQQEQAKSHLRCLKAETIFLLSSKMLKIIKMLTMYRKELPIILGLLIRQELIYI